MIAVDDDKLGVEAFCPAGVALFEDAAKGGRNRDPAFTIHLVVAFASEPARHAGPLSLPGPGGPLNVKSADQTAATV